MFNWSKQVILLTGGTGSFGNSFIEWLLKNNPPQTLRIYSRDEYKQYVMQKKFNHKSLRYFIGDVRDLERLKRALDGVTIVIHAAAMKQIEACEYNPTEAINTNIFGTINVLNGSIDAGVKRLIGLITDKAVSPTNLYGATKLCMEKILIQGNSYVGKGKTRISCVRYGNVAGSRGSVIPLFKEQMKKGILTLTHKDMTRFWIPMEKAVSFVVRCIENMEGGEVFIPKMKSLKLLDLAKIIAPNAKIKYIGIRPGEKLYEDLITIHEVRNVYEYKDYFKIYPEFDFWKKYSPRINGGKKVKPEFYYNSASNQDVLSIREMRKIIKNL